MKPTYSLGVLKAVNSVSFNSLIASKIQDEGWKDCRYGDVLLDLMNKLYPEPSEFEKKDATKLIHFSHCKYPAKKKLR